jgi:hypothetical protein
MSDSRLTLSFDNELPVGQSQITSPQHCVMSMIHREDIPIIIMCLLSLLVLAVLVASVIGEVSCYPLPPRL